MAKLFKAELYVIDHNDDFESFEDFETYITNYLRYGNIEFFNVKERKIDWHDDIDINHQCDIETYRKYFK